MDATNGTLGTETTPTLERGIGPHGRVAVTWSAAGGIALGGVLVALMTLSGRLSGFGLFQTTTGLFMIGAVIGLAHGVVLGYLGRPRETPGSVALGDLGRASLYAIPTAALAWLVTIWVAMTMPATYLDRWLPLAGVSLAWGIGVVVIAGAAVLGSRALVNAYARWPERRPGTVLVVASYVSLLVLFLADRPVVWGLRLRVTEVGAVLLAGFLTFWVAGPAITLALRLARELPSERAGTLLEPVAGTKTDLALGVAVGATLGVLAVPFLNGLAPAALGVGGGVVTAVSRAVVDEIVLRLVLLTGIAWVLLRWQRVHQAEAAVAAIGITTVIQLLLYAPGVAAIGFPTITAAVGFTIATVGLPAVAFGALYWKRGFGSALIADATAVVTLLLVTLA